MKHDQTEEVGIRRTQDGWYHTYVASFNTDRTVRVLGEGHIDEGLPTALSLRHMTEKQVAALYLGLAIFDHLQTGEHKMIYDDTFTNKV